MKRMILFPSILALSTLLLSACSVEVNTTINAAGAGKFGAGIGFTPEERQLLDLGQAAGGTTFCDEKLFTEQGADLPPGASVREETRGEESWCLMQAPFATLDNLRDAYSGMGNVTVNKLSLSGGRLVYDVTVDLSGGEQFTEGVQLNYDWRLTTPGAPANHNADEVNGNTLTWNLKPGESRTLHAESRGTNLTLWIIGGLLLFCLCLIVLVVAGGGLFYFSRRKRNALPPIVS